MSTRIVVVGGGTAGARLAQRLPVTLLGEEPHAPYNRLLLADVLAGRYGPEVITLPAAREPVRLGARAVRIDRAARTVECADGSLVPYDRLVLATGAAPVLPPLRGLRGAEPPSGVHPFRTLDDCLALRGAVRPGVRAVVVGGGLLGVSAARALAAAGAEVVLTQQGERLMERQLDAEASALLRAHLTDLGVEVHTECRVSGLRQRDGAVAAVELADGFVLDAGIVVLACGVRPRVALARAAGLDVRTGVIVDDQLRTSDPRVHAIGDCAEHAGRVYGLAGPALEQADVLADLLLAETPAGATGGATVSDPAGGGGSAPEAPEFARGAGASAPGAEASGAGPAGQAPDAGAGTTGLTTPPGPAAPQAPATSAGGPEGGPSGAATDGPGGHGPQPAHSPAPQAPATESGTESQASADPVGGARPLPRYTGTRALTRLTLGGARPLDLAAFGEADPLPGDDVVRLADATRGAYRKVVVRGDRLVGGVLLGDLGAVGTLARAWEGDEALPDAPLLHLLTHDGGSS
ncbi:FAD-dependent oxidoreductase [Streptomyces sp. NPDC004787]|uniref:FAD-dependent oxidoreductase n=1 Tax=Streptomyces sp. NPDC004787 TaxID=3154291 RepID=UPI0033ADCD79